MNYSSCGKLGDRSISECPSMQIIALLSRTAIMLTLHVLTWVLVVDVAWTSQQLHCNMTVQDVFSDSDLTPWSCRTRCGETFTQLPCACDHLCQLYTDCCDDFTAFCLNANKTSTDNTDAGISSGKNDTDTMRMENLLGTVACRYRTKLISKCPSPPVPQSQPQLLYGGKRITQDSVALLCDTQQEQAEDEDVNQAMPVTDAASGHHFANVYCLLCHGGKAEDILPWSLRFIWSMKHRALPQNISQLLQIARASNISAVALPPPKVKPRRCIPRSVFLNVKCDCHNLAHQCETADTSVASLRRFIFPHPSCAACFAVQKNADDVLQNPGIEQVVSLKNTFEFDVLMEWTSSPVGKGKTALKVEATSNRHKSFHWQRMSCDLTDVSNSSYQNMNLPMFGDENAQETLNGQGQQFREGNASNNPQREKHQTSFNSSSTSTTPEDNNQTYNSGADSKADRVDLANSPVNQPESTRISCSQQECAKGVPLFNNICRLDLIIREVHLLLTCLKLDLFTSITIPDPDSTFSLQPAVIASMSQVIQLYLKTQVETENITVATVGASRTRDGCIWNTTVSLYSPVGLSYSDNMTVQIIEHVNQALLNVNREPLDHFAHELHACGYVRKLSFFNIRDYGTSGINITCVMRAKFDPPKSANVASAQSGIKAKVANAVTLLCVLVIMRD